MGSQRGTLSPQEIENNTIMYKTLLVRASKPLDFYVVRSIYIEGIRG
jgi:hypothetical protein